MSNETSWSQAIHTLTLIGKQNPTAAHIKALQNGAVTDLLQAIMNGTLPSRDEVRKFYGLEPIQTKIVDPAALVSLGKGLKLGATKAVPMADLFRDGDGVVYWRRDGDFNNWFTPECPKAKACTFGVVTTFKPMTFQKMAQLATGNLTESIVKLSRAVVAQGLDINPAQFDRQIVSTQRGDSILQTNNSSNFAFAKTGVILKGEVDGDYEEVVILGANRNYQGMWRAYTLLLDRSGLFSVGDRLMLRDKN